MFLYLVIGSREIKDLRIPWENGRNYSSYWWQVLGLSTRNWLMGVWGTVGEKFYYEILFRIKLFQVFVLCFLNEMSWNCTCICKIELIFPFFFLHRWNILQSMVWRRVMRKTCLPLLKWRQRVRLVPPHTKEFSTPQDQWIHPQWMVISGSQGEIF